MLGASPNPPDHERLRRALVATSVSAALLLVAALGGLVWMLQKGRAHHDSLARTVALQRDVESLRVGLQRVGREVYEPLAADQQPQLARVMREEDLVRLRLAELAAAFAHDPARAQRFEALRARIEQQFVRLRSLARDGARPETVAAAQAGRAAIAAEIEALVADDAAARLQEHAESDRHDVAQTWVILGVASAALLLVVLSLWLNALLSRQREAARQALARGQADLERQVAVRTAALEESAAAERLRNDCARWMLATLDEPDDVQVVLGWCRHCVASGLVESVELTLPGLSPIGSVPALPADPTLDRDIRSESGLARARSRRRFAPADPQGASARGAQLLADFETWLELRRERRRRRDAEQAHDEAMARLAAVFDAAPVALAWTDPQGRLVHANRPFAALAGTEGRELEGRPMDALGSLAPVATLARRSRNTGVATGPEPVSIGAQRLFVSVVPLATRGGLPGGFAVALTDVTEIDGARARLAELTRRLMQVEENERRALALELHDDLGQRLAALKMNLGALALAADGNERRMRQADSLQIVEGCIAQVRERAASLRPALLDELGIEAALRAHVQAQARRSGLRIELDVQPGGLRGEAAWCQHAFRVAQEALRNTIEHAQASRVAITLLQRDGLCELTIADDGIGIDAAALARGTGLSGMRERAELLGGRLVFEANRPRGTLVRCSWPAADDRRPARQELAA